MEIIVNNDTKDITEVYDKRVDIKYHYNTYRDISNVYRSLFDRATGRYIYYLEDDDYIRRNFFTKLNLDVDINFMEYISEPIIKSLGFIDSHRLITKSRYIDHKSPVGFLNEFDHTEFQLGQILFKKSTIKNFPQGNDLQNDYMLFTEVVSNSTTFNYIADQTWVQTTDGMDNISFPELNTDVRFKL
jgi:hypothetical protein